MLTCEAITNAPKAYSCHPQEYCLDILTLPKEIGRPRGTVSSQPVEDRKREAKRVYDKIRYAQKQDEILAKQGAYYARVREMKLAKGRAERRAQAAAEGRPFYKHSARTLDERKALKNQSLQAWRRANPDKWVAQCRRTYANTRLNVIARANNRRAKVRENGGKFTGADIRALLEAQQGFCALCAAPLGEKFHVDHWIPVKLGGSSNPENLRLMHAKCNMLKGAKHPAVLGLIDSLAAR